MYTLKLYIFYMQNSCFFNGCNFFLSLSGHTGRYLIVVLTFSSIFLLAQVIFQSTLLGIATDSEPYGSTLSNCKYKLSWGMPNKNLPYQLENFRILVIESLFEVLKLRKYHEDGIHWVGKVRT